MIRHFLLPCFFFLFMPFLQSQTNNLVVFCPEGKRFLLSLNHEPVNTVPQADVKASGLTAGKQVLRIEFRDGTLQQVYRDSVMISPDEKLLNKEVTYAIEEETEKNGATRFRLRFITINTFSGPEAPQVPEAPKEKVPLIDNSIYGILYRAKANAPVFYHNYNDSSNTCTTALGDKDMSYLDQLINRSNDFERKFSYVMETVRNNCYNTTQLKQMLTYLPIELDKLKACKEGYWHLTDKQNAPQLQDALIYKTIQDDFKSYLKDLDMIRKEHQRNCTDTLSSQQFEAMFKAMKNAGYDTDKLNEGKRQLGNKCLRTAQVAQILTLFTHDRDKLQYARLVYPQVSDKEHFQSLADDFQFEETRSEFKKYYSQ